MNIHISKGNIKMNAIPSFSLPSGITCSQTACRTCYIEGCYARKIEKLRPNVHKNYMENYDAAKNHLEALEKALDYYFDNPNAPRLFRIHVAGDFFSTAYFEMWLRIIAAHPNTKFLAFTKRSAIIRPFVKHLPQNFSLVWSAWPGVKIPAHIKSSLPIAWMQDGKDKRIPSSALECQGNCETCAKCWAMGGHDVVFHKH